MALLSITANDIDTAGVSVDRDLPCAWLDEELADAQATALGPGHVKARLSRTGEEIVVRGEVKAEVVLPCARCLDPARYDVTGEIALLLVPAKVDPPPKAKAHAGKANGKAHPKPAIAAEPEEVEITSEDAERDTFDGETVVLDPFVREAILLELPNFPLCSEACPGIRPAPGAQAPEVERVDPRLAPLGALRARLAAEPKAGAERAEKSKRPPAPNVKAPPKAPSKKKKAKE